MTRNKKLCVIGGGGVRTPFVAKTVATRAASSGIAELILFDTDKFKLEKIGSISKEIASRIDSELKVTLQNDAHLALKDCDFIITTVRAGGDSSRRLDEELVKKHGLLAQETTGACGFAMAMRSIPVIDGYCQIAREVAKPNHLIFNFTNPAGLVTQALISKGYPAIGICDSPAELIRQLVELLEVSESDFSCNSFGLNHLSWFNDFRVNGKDVSDIVVNHPELFIKTEMRLFDKDILNFSDKYLLNEYLYFYFYNKKAIRLSNSTNRTRAEIIEDVNLKMNSELSNVDVSDDFPTALNIFFENYNVRENSYLLNESGVPRVKSYTTPTVDEFIAQEDSGGYAGVALKLVSSLLSAEPSEMVLSVPNNGAIEELADEDVIEISCVIANGTITPKSQRNIPTHILNLIQSVKEYERLAVEAIKTRDLNLAVKALTVNPLVANHDIAKELVQDFVDAYDHYSGEWK